MNAWIGGRGEKQRIYKPKSTKQDDENKVEESIWNQMDKSGQYISRGIEIHRKVQKDKGLSLLTNGKTGIDGYIYNKIRNETTLYEVVSINIFCDTYVNDPRQIKYNVNEKIKKLNQFADNSLDLIENDDVQNSFIIKKLLVVVPDNTPAELVYQIESYYQDPQIEVIKGFGDYVQHEKSEE
jgi:hypothetical protein